MGICWVFKTPCRAIITENLKYLTNHQFEKEPSDIEVLIIWSD